MKKILIVDDDAAILRMLACMAGELGAEAHCAISCQSARTLLQRLKPDITLIDEFLPDGRGSEFAKTLPNCPHVVLMSASFTPKHETRDVLAKPINMNTLKRLLA